MFSTIRFPVLQADVACAIAPRQIACDGGLLFLMAAIVRIIHRKLLQGREVTFNAVQPRGVGRRPVKPDAVGGDVPQHFIRAMKRGVVQHDMQRDSSRILLSQPLQKRQERLPVFMGGKGTDQRVAFEVIGPEHVPHAAVTVIRRPQAIDMPHAGVVPAVPGQQIQRAELVEADPLATLRPFRVQSSNSPVFGPELRIGRFLPGLGVPPANFAVPQNLPQGLQRNGPDDPLLHQIIPQLRQRPDAHADQFFRRRQGDFTDLFADIRQELPRPVGPALIRIPRDRLDAAGVEAMNDLSHPDRRAAALPGDLSVRQTAARQQKDAGVSAIDSVDQVSFHTMQRSALVRPERPCSNPVHVLFSTANTGCSNSRSGELMYTICCGGANPLLSDTYRRETL